MSGYTHERPYRHRGQSARTADRTGSDETAAADDGGDSVVLGIAGGRLGGTPRRRVAVVGSSRGTRALAAHLADRFDVTFVSDRQALLGGLPENVETLSDSLDGDSALAGAGIEADAAVVATDRDRTNLLVAQQLKTASGVGRIVVRLNDPEREDVFAAAGVATVCPSDHVAPAVETLLGTEA